MAIKALKPNVTVKTIARLLTCALILGATGLFYRPVFAASHRPELEYLEAVNRTGPPRPSFRTTKFGMLCTPYRAATAGERSVSTLRTTALPAICRATRATSGAARRQGAHHAAQKSTSTGTDASRTTSSNVASSASIGSETGGKGALQLPQRPRSARWRGRTRFGRSHAGQRRIMARICSRLRRRQPAAVTAAHGGGSRRAPRGRRPGDPQWARGARPSGPRSAPGSPPRAA